MPGLGKALHCLLIFSMAIVLAPANSSAEEQVIAVATPVGDEIGDHIADPKVSGTGLVGLRLGGDEAAAFNSDDVSLAFAAGLETDPEHSHICVFAVSRDGRYTNSTFYAVANRPPDASALKLQPFASEKYEVELRSYKQGDIAVKAYLAADESCAWKNELHLPEVGLGEGVRNRLVAFINTGGAFARASLTPVGAAVLGASLPCIPVGEGLAHIAYDQTCNLPVGPGSPYVEGKLRIEVDDGLVSRQIEYDLLMPSAGE